MTLEELIRVLVLRITITTTLDGGWSASIDGGEFKEGSTLAGAVGFGRTPTQALISLSVLTLGKTLVIDAMKPSRREYQMPMRWQCPEEDGAPSDEEEDEVVEYIEYEE